MRGKSHLAPDTTIMDYVSPARIREAFGSEAAIRAEYSRQRSIIRKRIERMQQAGETSNWVYNQFGNLTESMPTARDLSTDDMMKIMSASARVLSGGYNATMREIRASRQSAQEALAAQAEENGDDETADYLRNKMTNAQWRRITQIVGMLQGIMGKKAQDSNELFFAATDVVMNNRGERSLLTLVSTTISEFALDADINEVAEKFTSKGRVRMSWKKAHSKRGK